MTQATFSIGQVITHKLYGYKAVIVDADAQFAQSDDWYSLMVKGNPEKQQPWYYLLVDGTQFKTYVAESFLEVAQDDIEIEHPDLSNVTKATLN